MDQLSIVAAGEGEVVGDSADRRVEILSDGPAVHATWSRFGAGREGADLHVHRKHTDFFFVLEGVLTVRVGPDGEQRSASAGSLVRVPPMVVHGFANEGDEEVRYLNFHIPGCGFADFMRGLRDGDERPYDQYEPPADGGRDPGEASIGQPTEPFAFCTLDAGETLGAPRAEAVERSLFVLEGEIEMQAEKRAARGAWVGLSSAAVAVRAVAPTRLLVLDLASS